MKEKLLLKCDNTIYADEIVEFLLAHDIPTRLHDESMDTVVGAYGAVTGIALFVSAADYERAWKLVQPIVEQRNTSYPTCPKCGSKEVELIVQRFHLGAIFAVLSLLCIVIPILYAALSAVLNLRSDSADVVALAMVGAGVVLMFVSKHFNVNHRCTQCGYKFNYFTSK